MTYGIMLGSNLYIGTNGVLTVTDENSSTGKSQTKEFFRIREIDRKRSHGSYLVVDCDIKDPNGNREVKLFKSRPVAASPEIEVLNPEKAIEVRRRDGSLVIRVEELGREALNIRSSDPIASAIEKIEAILRITGDFQAGTYRVRADKNQMQVGGIVFSGNVKIGGGGLHLSEKGIAF